MQTPYARLVAGLVLISSAALSGCTAADKAAVNAAFAPIHAEWERRTNENPLLGLDLALQGVADAEQARAYRAMMKQR